MVKEVESKSIGISRAGSNPAGDIFEDAVQGDCWYRSIGVLGRYESHLVRMVKESDSKSDKRKLALVQFQ